MTSYPVYLTMPHPQRNNRWLAVLGILLPLKLIALIPHFAVIYYLAAAMAIASWINFWIILFTGKSSHGVQKIQHGVFEWVMRVQAWFAGLTDKYPPLSMDTTEASHPVMLRVAYPQMSNRGLAVLGILLPLRYLLLIPHLVVLVFLWIWYFIVTWINFWAILFTGHGIASVQRYQHGTLQWMVRVQAYLLGLTDQYPPFSLELAQA